MERSREGAAVLIEISERMMRPPGGRPPGGHASGTGVPLRYQAAGDGHGNGQDDRHDRRAGGEYRRHQDVRIIRHASYGHRPLPGDGSGGGVKQGQGHFGPVGHRIHGSQGHQGLVRRRDGGGGQPGSDRDRPRRRRCPRHRVRRGSEGSARRCPRGRRSVHEHEPGGGLGRRRDKPGARTAAHAQVRQREEGADANPACQYLAATEPRLITIDSGRIGFCSPPWPTHGYMPPHVSWTKCFLKTVLALLSPKGKLLVSRPR